MNIQEKKKRLKDALEKNIKQENVGIAIAITGSWGIGKTYFWNEFLKDVTHKELQDKKNFYYEASRVSYKSIFDCRKYAYISLFGIENLSELKNAICTKLTLNPYAKSDISKWEFSQIVKSTVGQFRDLKVSQYGIIASAKILESLLFLQVKDAIICFDDFERISNKLDIKDVMGLANQLKLEKNCQIILILDEDKAESENKKKYVEYKEKLIDDTIIINSVEPLIRENAKDIEEKLIALMIAFADGLEIYNFRFFLKVIKLYREFRKQLPSEVAYSTKEVILTRIIQGYLISDYGRVFGIDWKGFTIEKAIDILDNNDNLDNIADKIYKKIYNILPNLFGAIDSWGVQFKNWFQQKNNINNDILHELANSEMISERLNMLKESKRKLWNQCWNNQINITFPKQLYDITFQLIGYEEIESLYFSYEILNKFGSYELAYRLKAKIYQWINIELKNDQLGFIEKFASWKRSKNCFYDYIDKYRKRNLYVGLPSLSDTVHQYIIQNSWNTEHTLALEYASKEEWKKLLFNEIPQDERFQYYNSNLIASKMIQQIMKPELNPKIRKIIIEIYEEKGRESEFYKNYMNYLISRLDD